MGWNREKVIAKVHKGRKNIYAHRRVQYVRVSEHLGWQKSKFGFNGGNIYLF